MGTPSTDFSGREIVNNRRTNYYALTRRGQREIDARSEWEAQYVEGKTPKRVLDGVLPQNPRKNSSW